jgi:hypothetical protein
MTHLVHLSNLQRYIVQLLSFISLDVSCDASRLKVYIDFTVVIFVSSLRTYMSYLKWLIVSDVTALTQSTTCHL